jgi:primosomal replication protein N
MMQTSLFPQEVRNGQQPQRTASKAQASRPPVNDNRQAPAPAQQAAKRTPDNKNRSVTAQGGRRPQAGQPIDSIRLSGRIGRYIEVKQTQTGKSLATFSLATWKHSRDQSGNWLKRTIWQRIVVWGDTAESLAERLRQGALVTVEGRYKTREWTDRDNNLHTTTELVARHVEFMDLAAA